MADTNIAGLTLREERPGEERVAEELTREAFFNRYAPGCTEHWVLHLLRQAPGFLPWHSIVAEYDSALIGHALLSPGVIHTDGGREVSVLTLGPISVLPACYHRGIGSALMRRAIAQARLHGALAMFLTGDPKYYHRFGFTSASLYGIRYPGIPAGGEAPFFMALPLFDGALAGCEGVYAASPLFEDEGPEYEAYEATFPPRRKLRLPGQLR